jgi:death-on-curing protein
MRQPRHLTVGDVIAIHEEMMRRLGLPPAGIRDKGGLEAAIHRPRQAAYYEDADIIRQGVILAAGISQSHAFVDGNKRTALESMYVFLYVNDYQITGDRIEAADWLIHVAERRVDRDAAVDEFEAWLRHNTRDR